MQKLVIEGGIPLEGEIFLHGAKNSALPILAGTLLCDGETTLENCPRLTDVFAACRILTHLGCRCMIQEHTVTVQVRDLRSDTIPEALMQEMRSSIIFWALCWGVPAAATCPIPAAVSWVPVPLICTWMPCGRWAHIFLYMGDSWIAPHRRDCTAQPYTCRSLRWERQKT